MIISNNSLQIPHGISENANFPTNSSWSSSYHVNHYLWLIITFDIPEDAKFSKNPHGISIPDEVFNYHVNDYLSQLSLKTLKRMLFAPIRFSEER